MAINGEVQWKFTMGVVDQAEKIEHVDSKNEDEPVHPRDRRVWASHFRRGRHDSVVVSFGFRGNRFETQLENIEDTPEQTSMSSFIPPKQMPSAAEASHSITLRHDHIPCSQRCWLVVLAARLSTPGHLCPACNNLLLSGLRQLLFNSCSSIYVKQVVYFH